MSGDFLDCIDKDTPAGNTHFVTVITDIYSSLRVSLLVDVLLIASFSGLSYCVFSILLCIILSVLLVIILSILLIILLVISSLFSLS